MNTQQDSNRVDRDHNGAGGIERAEGHVIELSMPAPSDILESPSNGCCLGRLQARL